MSTAGYLQDAKNQQSRLASILTNKGITASATEKYNSLVDKVEQIEELKGEERTLENFTNVLDKPKQVVQLEYPDDTIRTLSAKLTSKNLIPYPYRDSSKTANGITFTVNEDGTVTANGTATSAAYFSLQIRLPLQLNTTYTLSGSPTGASSSTYCLYMTNTGVSDWSTGTTNDQRGSGTFTLTKPGGTNGYGISLVVYSGTVCDNVVFSPQIKEGATVTAYTPYISDFSTVNVTRCGKNLIPYPYANSTQTLNGVTFTVNSDGTIAVSGTATATTTFYLNTVNNTTPNLIGQTITLSGCPNGGGDNKYRLRYQQSGVPSDVGNGATFTVTKPGYITVQVFANQTVDNLIFKPQIELGSVSSDYEQYTGTSYTPTATGEVTGITTLYPTTTLLTDVSTVFTGISGDVYKTIVSSDGKNGITKVLQPNVTSGIDSNIVPENIKKDASILGTTGDYICNYSYDDTTKELVLLL